MKCWETLLPQTVRHPLITVDLTGLLKAYQRRYPGAMYSGCGGGYLIVASEEAGARRVPGQGPPRTLMSLPKQVIVSGGFDDLRSRHLRFLEEAAKLGDLTVLLWPDETLRQLTGKAPKFPLAERIYFLNAVRYVRRVVPVSASADVDTLPKVAGLNPQVWVDEEADRQRCTQRASCRAHKASSIACCRRRR